MIYGKVTCRIEADKTAGDLEHKTIFLTVTGHTSSIKQGGDLVRLTWNQARELAFDLCESIAELEASNKAA